MKGRMVYAGRYYEVDLDFPPGLGPDRVADSGLGCVLCFGVPLKPDPSRSYTINCDGNICLYGVRLLYQARGEDSAIFTWERTERQTDEEDERPQVPGCPTCAARERELAGAGFYEWDAKPELHPWRRGLDLWAATCGLIIAVSLAELLR